MIVCFIFIALLQNTFAKVITEENVTESAMKHFPKVLASYQEINEKKSGETVAMGAFDAKFKSSTEAVILGYYRRRFLDNVIEKPLGYLGSKIYVGKSYGPGNFPPMQNLNATNDQASPRVGLTFSLLRNRDIDTPRMDLKNAKLDTNIAKANNKAVKIDVYQSAAISYWSWVATIQVENIYEDLLNMAIKRDSYFQQKVKNGDMPDIVIKENNQYIARRKADLAHAQLAKKQAIYDLSLFLRDDSGSPIILSDADAPEKFNDDFSTPAINNELEINKALTRRPEFETIQLELTKIENSRLNARNFLLPMFDFGAEVLRNLGGTDPTNHHHVYTLLFKIEIPLERNVGLGSLQQVQAKKTAIEYEKKYLQESIKNEIEKKIIEMKIAKDSITYSKTELEMAKQMAMAENYRFQKGASDLYLINLREEAYSDAQIKLVDSKFRYLKSLVEYNAQTVSFKGL